MVVITASHTVVPREPTPNNPLELSPIDKKQRYHISSIFIYKQDKQNDTIEVPIHKMKESLSHVLVYYYPLAGRFQRIDGDELQVDCNSKGALLLEATSELKLIDYGSFAPSGLVEKLVPIVDYSTDVGSWPLLLVQLTRFSCGGICIGVTICHSLVDAWSKYFFVNSWAKLFGGQVLDKDEIPIYDRTILKPKFPVQRLHHDEFSAPPLLLGRSDTKEEKQNETTPMLLHLTKVQVEMLKRANEVSDARPRDHKYRPYSRFEVLSAHIWRSACKARQVGRDANQPTLVRMPVAIHNRLSPPVPRNYMGNAIMTTRTPKCTFGDIISRPLCYSAQKMRAAVDRVTDERIRSAIDLLSHNDSDSPHLPRTGSNKAHFYGNPNIIISSVMNMPMYQSDFGWGKPFYVGLTSLEVDGKTFILPAHHSDGSVNILICLQVRHAESFKKYFFEEVIQESRSSSTKGTSKL